MDSSHSIRHSIRQQRQALAPGINRLHGEAVARRLVSLLLFRKAMRIGVYLSVKGELDTAPVIKLARTQRKSLYLPVLHPFLHGRLLFCRWNAGDRLVMNRYGIGEPECRSTTLLHPRSLDIVFVPLVAFDAHRNRVGMGGGYYDRTFGYLKSFRQWQRPLLVGIAHQFQQVESIDVSAWDVPLDLVITESMLL
ncbi:MAG: 5-formyltetrahydrofolate cyclo-ligase [Gammaproteobacteria bacterium]|jgi:5-formyltetrahydrofolate cyclo-ligase